MSSGIDESIANMSGSATLPRKNGELAFEAPWQGRAFGIATALHQHGAYDWEDFRQRLIAHIEAGAPDTAEHSTYYEHWLAALESLLVARGLVGQEELALRVHEFKSGTRNEVP